MSKLTIYSLEGLLVSCFAAADRGIGFNDQIFFFRTSLYLELDLHLPSTPVRNATNLRSFC